jgi:hypothetical protein
MPSAPPPGSFGSSGTKAASAPGASAAAFAAPPRGGGSYRGGGSFHGGGNFRDGGLRGGNLSRLDGSVRAGRQDFRAVGRTDLRQAQGVPGFSLLS